MRKLRINNPRRNTVSKWMTRKNLDYRSKSGVNPINYSYKTHGFNIKYIEEECDLNEVAYFEQMIDVPCLEEAKEINNLRVPLNMEITLFYADDPDNVDFMRKSAEVNFDYEKVSMRTYRLGNLMKGIYKFVPVEFTYSLASVLSTSVH